MAVPLVVHVGAGLALCAVLGGSLDPFHLLLIAASALVVALALAVAVRRAPPRRRVLARLED